MAKKKVLLVDTDTQGQACYMLGAKPKWRIDRTGHQRVKG